ncbi:MAG: hypothetical protein QN122_13535 [Armatimonadota bacterium]|nr:hypothetical protein [Armatimonadota bacterium]
MDAPRYEVLSVAELAEPLPTGQLQRVTVITFRTRQGFQGQLRVPEVPLTPERAQELLEAEVARIEAIYQLGR